MKVWIDQDLCTGDGLCTDHAPDVFASRHSGIVAAMSTLAANPIHRYGPASARRCAVGAPGASSRAIVTANLRRRVALGAARRRGDGIIAWTWSLRTPALAVCRVRVKS